MDTSDSLSCFGGRFLYVGVDGGDGESCDDGGGDGSFGLCDLGFGLGVLGAEGSELRSLSVSILNLSVSSHSVPKRLRLTSSVGSVY